MDRRSGRNIGVVILGRISTASPAITRDKGLLGAGQAGRGSVFGIRQTMDPYQRPAKAEIRVTDEPRCAECRIQGNTDTH